MKLALAKKYRATLVQACKRHEALWGTGLNLVASVNVPTPGVSRLLSSDLGNRVAEGPLGGRFFPGLASYDVIETLGLKVCKELFDCEDADLRPISGTVANLAVYLAFAGTGRKILTVSLRDGGHVSMAGQLPISLGYQVLALPFATDMMNINTEAALQQIKHLKPDLLILGGSVILFPQPVQRLAEAARDIDCTTVFDGSHVAGLIAGGRYPNPLREGADLMTFTTCKTIPGPQHAFVIGKTAPLAKVRRAITALHSGHHLHATAGAIYACIELLAFGSTYAAAVIENAISLAQKLAELDIKVVGTANGWTKTHMLMVDATEYGGGKRAEELLAAAQIFVNRNLLPGDSGTPSSPSGLRIGTPEATRIGMRPADMVCVAGLVARTLKGEKPAKIREEVRELRQSFPTLHYSLEGL